MTKLTHLLAYPFLVVFLLTACSKTQRIKPTYTSASGGEASKDFRQVEIGSTPLKVGQRFHVTKMMYGNNSPKSGKSTEVQSTEATNRRVVEEEILAVDEGRKSRWRLKVVQDDSTYKSNGKLEQDDSLLAGKTYVLWYADGILQASKDNGDSVEVHVLSLLRGNYGPDQKKWRTLFDVLPSRKFVIDSPLVLSAEAVRALSRGTDKLKSMTITLRSVDRGTNTARFEQEFVFSVPVPRIKTHIPMTFKGSFDASLDDGVFLRHELRARAEYTALGQEFIAERNISRTIVRLKVIGHQ